jgi:hypothetical protein
MTSVKLNNENKLTVKSEDPRPRFTSTTTNSLSWRLWHSINYIIGGSTFLIGSMCYFPFIQNYFDGFVVGAYLFTIGSLAFLLADFTEWNHFRVGSFDQPDYIKDWTIWKSLRRAEVAVNFFISAIGSFLYLLGSICFIPSLDLLLDGEILFIWGSLIIVLAQTWKVLRTMFYNEQDPNANFNWDNVREDYSGFGVDVCAGVGAGFYAVGTYLFKMDANDITAVYLFCCGGFFFFLSGVFMKYRYYWKKVNENENHVDDNYVKMV